MTDADWAAKTPRQRDAMVAEVLWPEGRPLGHPLRISEMLASTWAGFGLVVEAMSAKGWHLSLVSTGELWFAEWRSADSVKESDIQIKGDCYRQGSAPSATALAAIRAMEGATK